MANNMPGKKGEAGGRNGERIVHVQISNYKVHVCVFCEGFKATLPFKHAENTNPSCQVRIMRRNQG